MIRLPLSWLWAAREVLRAPAEAALVALALSALAAVAGTTLLLQQAVSATAAELVAEGPSLVVRRLGAGGFEPLPEGAVEALAAVRGARDVHARVWGPVSAGGDPATLWGLDAHGAELLSSAGLTPPGAAEVVAGPGLPAGDALSLIGPGGARELPVTARLPDSVGAEGHRILLASPELARELLGLPAGASSDVALDVLHESEEDAIRPDLARALPYPTVIETRTEALGAEATAWGRLGSLSLSLLLPALLAIAALVVGAARDRAGRRRELGLLRALGWTTADILRLQGWRALWLGLPATALGLAVAWLLVFTPAMRWPATLLLGWSGPPPRLLLRADGAALVALEVAALTLLPWALASLWPALRAATRDPDELLGGGAP